MNQKFIELTGILKDIDKEHDPDVLMALLEKVELVHILLTVKLAVMGLKTGMSPESTREFVINCDRDYTENVRRNISLSCVRYGLTDLYDVNAALREEIEKEP